MYEKEKLCKYPSYLPVFKVFDKKNDKKRGFA
ncbi:MAG: hypothetical protein RL757_1689 [Bacteroidota bacterium]|jgi:hypothetical protein